MTVFEEGVISQAINMTANDSTSAIRNPTFRAFLFTYFMAMMADNIEHVISYWVCFEKFHSVALQGFAVIAHWLPFLLLSIPMGALNDIFDARRLIQIGMGMFMLVSLAWSYLFFTDTLQLWHAVVLLVIHGCAGVFWSTSSQMLLYDIVQGRSLPSAVRLHATTRYLACLAGPAIGNVLMHWLGTNKGILVNSFFYLPTIAWLFVVPYHRTIRTRAVRGLSDIFETLRAIKNLPVISSMVFLSGAAAFFIGNSYHAQMPGFANDFSNTKPGTAYTLLLGADAIGALLAGIMLELRGTWLRQTPSLAMRVAWVWGAALLSFSLTRNYTLGVALLFVAGFCELTFGSMSQALVQIHAPDSIRGRVLGVFGMASSGLRTFSGMTVGLMGSFTSIHFSLAISAFLFILATAAFGQKIQVVAEAK